MVTNHNFLRGFNMRDEQRIIVQNLTYKTATNQVLFNGLNFTLADVKTGLVSRNGIGKSTLLKLIIKNLQPTSGTIKVVGTLDYCPQDSSPYYDLTIAQFFNIANKLRALENISQGSIDPQDFIELADNWNIRERILKYLEKFSLKTKDLTTKIDTLSNGEITKLYLAKIFNPEATADFIILDEPTNNLDSNTRTMLYQSIQQSSQGMIIVSHDAALLELMDQILSLTECGVKIYGGNFSLYKRQQKIEHDAKEQHLINAQKTLKKARNSIQASYEKHAQN
ncbi:MAG: ATP-binding cassette domain-containing protein [Coxiellaceae bacterium]|jgi:ATPase subunit of ABC transporter with duplicated ATPase domains|nr:ATP-binding cassette domain-containing protein [Coxiellaceae bacterium]